MTTAPFFFFVHNRNHVRLLVPVAERLRAKSCAVTLVDLDAWNYREGATPELQRLGSSSVSIEDLAKSPPSRGVFVMANDWGPVLLSFWIDFGAMRSGSSVSWMDADLRFRLDIGRLITY